MSNVHLRNLETLMGRKSMLRPKIISGVGLFASLACVLALSACTPGAQRGAAYGAAAGAAGGAVVNLLTGGNVLSGAAVGAAASAAAGATTGFIYDQQTGQN